jgi:biopolymer transport protein TolR
MGANVSGPGRHRQALAEINVTPLVDVMLVLLIISMLAAPMLQRGINLELPQTATATTIEEARVVVTVDRDGRIKFNDRPVHEAMLEERMMAVAAANPGETVFLRADKLLPYGEVLRVMDKIRTAGIERVSLVTVPLEIVEDSGS